MNKYVGNETTIAVGENKKETLMIYLNTETNKCEVKKSAKSVTLFTAENVGIAKFCIRNRYNEKYTFNPHNGNEVLNQ